MTVPWPAELKSKTKQKKILYQAILVYTQNLYSTHLVITNKYKKEKEKTKMMMMTMTIKTKRKEGVPEKETKWPVNSTVYKKK